MELALRKAADHAGSVSALARAIGISNQTVAAWIYRKSIPPEHCAAVERASGGTVSRRDLRPNDWGDIWPELIDDEHPWPELVARSDAPEGGAA